MGSYRHRRERPTTAKSKKLLVQVSPTPLQLPEIVYEDSYSTPVADHRHPQKSPPHTTTTEARGKASGQLKTCSPRSLSSSSLSKEIYPNMASSLPTSFLYPTPSSSALKLAYIGQNLNDIQAPAAILDVAVIRRNCKLMLETAEKLNVGFRAHVKTHKVRRKNSPTHEEDMIFSIS